ncbi:MAG: ABC transporter ATP-binding protein [Candidatus Aminicenantaceae bacterium]
MLELKNIQHGFPESDWTLRISSLELFSGEIFSIIGPNGSGKSTLLRIASGVLEPLGGTILLNGKNMFELKRRTIARSLGYLPQETVSLYDFTVEEVVRMGRYPHTQGFGTLENNDMAVVQECLALTEMTSLKERPLSRLSGGEKKRAFLASVLAQKPEILLLDEPTSALDVHHQVQFFRLLQSLSRDGMGVAVVTHDINLASLFSDRLMILSGGEPVVSGPPAEVLTASTVHAVYGEDILMGFHPETGNPTILPKLVTEKKSEG